MNREIKSKFVEIEERLKEFEHFKKRLDKIKDYNKTLATTADKNLKLDDEQIRKLKESLNIERENLARVQDFDKRIESLLRMERGAGKLKGEETLAEELKIIIAEDDKVGNAITELIKYYQEIRPHVYNLKRTLNLENETVKGFDQTIKKKIAAGEMEPIKARLLTLNNRLSQLIAIEKNSAKFLQDSQTKVDGVIRPLKSVEEDMAKKGVDTKGVLKGLEDMQEMVKVVGEIEEQEKEIRLLERFVRSVWGKTQVIGRVNIKEIWDRLGELSTKSKEAAGKALRGI